MNLKPLTPQQMADIVFQRPERLTAGVLERRSVSEKLRDRFLTHAAKPLLKAPDRVSRTFLQLYTDAPVAAEHPRALKKSLFELKALGFSNEQVNRLEQKILWDFWFGYFTEVKRATALGRQVAASSPDPLYVGFSPDSFLGAAAIFRQAGKVARNYVVDSDAEPLAYHEFVRFFEGLAKKNPDLFRPARDNKRYQALNP